MSPLDGQKLSAPMIFKDRPIIGWNEVDFHVNERFVFRVLWQARNDEKREWSNRETDGQGLPFSRVSDSGACGELQFQAAHYSQIIQ